MANVKRAKGEDPQAETRVGAPTVNANVAPVAPKAPNASGGAPKLQGMIDVNRPDMIGKDLINQPTLEVAPVKRPNYGPGGQMRPTFGDIAEAYEKGVARYMPVPRRAQPWRADQAQTNLGKLYKEKLDSETLVSAPRPPWTIEQVRQAEPEFISSVRERLWEMYTNASEDERNSDFMQGIRQNPDYAAATMVRRLLMNSQQRDAWMTGESTPKLGEAVRNSLQLSNTWRWLNYVQGHQGKPLSAPPVTPPRAAEGGLKAVKALRKG